MKKVWAKSAGHPLTKETQQLGDATTARLPDPPSPLFPRSPEGWYLEVRGKLGPSKGKRVIPVQQEPHLLTKEPQLLHKSFPS